MSDVVLSAGVRQNLLALQSTADLMSLTQNRLATGKKVNSALDNPGNFFTSQSLNNRASDLNALLDSIGQAQKTLEAADQGITSLTKLVESAKSVAKQALQAPQPGVGHLLGRRSLRQPDRRNARHDRHRRVAHGRQHHDLLVRQSTSTAPARTTVSYTADASATYRRNPRRPAGELRHGAGGPRHRRRRMSTLVTNGAGTGIHDQRDQRRHRLHDRQRAPPPASSRTAPTPRPACSTTSARPATTLTVAVNGGANQVDHLRHRRSARSPRSPSCRPSSNTISGITATASNAALDITLNSAIVAELAARSRRRTPA